jgi:multicomponent Na+:H+ antiporter subunit D
MNGINLLLPVVLPILAAMVIPFLLEKKKEAIRPFIIGTVFVNLIINWVTISTLKTRMFHIWTLNDFIDVFLKVDELGILFSLLVSVLWIFTTFYAIGYMDHEKHQERFFAFFIMTLGITNGIAYSGNLFTLYIFYELLTLATYPLVIHSETEEALYSGKKYLIYSFGGATFILLGMILLYTLTNDISFVAGGLPILEAITKDQTLLMIYIIIFLGFGVKAALVPFHSWLAAAMVAPTPVSALLHAVAVVKSGVFALLRVCYYVFGADVVERIEGNVYISVLIVLTILLGSLLALHQDHLKKRLAYSTISQLGYILLGIVILNENALLGGILHLINHALIKITLFFCVGAIYVATHKTYIQEIKGIGRKMPIVMWCFAIASFSLIGVPPSNGFVSKWYLALGALGAARPFFAALLMLSAFLTAAYLLPIVVTAFFQTAEDGEDTEYTVSHYMTGPILVLTSVIVILGLFPNPIVGYIENIVMKLM